MINDSIDGVMFMKEIRRMHACFTRLGVSGVDIQRGVSVEPYNQIWDKVIIDGFHSNLLANWHFSNHDIEGVTVEVKGVLGELCL